MQLDGFPVEILDARWIAASLGIVAFEDELGAVAVVRAMNAPRKSFATDKTL